MSTRRRLLLSPLLVLVALATVLGAGTVSASAAHGSETRVRAIPTATADAVGPQSSETAGSVGCLRPVQPAIVSGSCVATNTGLDATTARLQGHVDAAVADYESGAIGMSPNQARAAAVNPNLEPAYRGSVIDQAAKTRIVADPGLDVSVTPNFQFGPDVYNTNGNWWDMTTPGQWEAHVDKYTPGFGTGTILRT